MSDGTDVSLSHCELARLQYLQEQLYMHLGFDIMTTEAAVPPRSTSPAPTAFHVVANVDLIHLVLNIQVAVCASAYTGAGISMTIELVMPSSTTVTAVLAAIAHRTGRPASHLRLLHDGERLQLHKALDSLDSSSSSVQLDVVAEQSGGASNAYAKLSEQLHDGHIVPRRSSLTWSIAQDLRLLAGMWTAWGYDAPNAEAAMAAAAEVTVSVARKRLKDLRNKYLTADVVDACLRLQKEKKGDRQWRRFATTAAAAAERLTGNPVVLPSKPLHLQQADAAADSNARTALNLKLSSASQLDDVDATDQALRLLFPGQLWRQRRAASRYVSGEYGGASQRGLVSDQRLEPVHLAYDGAPVVLTTPHGPLPDAAHVERVGDALHARLPSKWRLSLNETNVRLPHVPARFTYHAVDVTADTCVGTIVDDIARFLKQTGIVAEPALHLFYVPPAAASCADAVHLPRDATAASSNIAHRASRLLVTTCATHDELASNLADASISAYNPRPNAPEHNLMVNALLDSASHPEGSVLEEMGEEQWTSIRRTLRDYNEAPVRICFQCGTCCYPSEASTIHAKNVGAIDDCRAYRVFKYFIDALASKLSGEAAPAGGDLLERYYSNQGPGSSAFLFHCEPGVPGAEVYACSICQSKCKLSTGAGTEYNQQSAAQYGLFDGFRTSGAYSSIGIGDGPRAPELDALNVRERMALSILKVNAPVGTIAHNLHTCIHTYMHYAYIHTCIMHTYIHAL